MKERDENILPQDKDRHLDVPQEASRDKHINFLDVEDGSNDHDRSHKKDKETTERQRQWREGLEEGKKARRGAD